jgi:hypothetical protein
VNEVLILAQNELFLPKDLSVPRPLLLALHGGGRDGASQIELWRSLAERDNFILLAPNSLKPPFIEATWFAPDNGQNLTSKIDEVLKRYPVAGIYEFKAEPGTRRLPLRFGLGKKTAIPLVLGVSQQTFFRCHCVAFSYALCERLAIRI